MTSSKRDARGRFRQGSSGNLEGRPRKQRSNPPIHPRQVRTDFFEAAHHPITIKIDGQRREVTRIRALFEVEFAEALKGDSPSRRRLLDHYIRFSAEHDDAQVELMELLLEGEKRQMETEDRGGSPFDSLLQRCEQDREYRESGFTHRAEEPRDGEEG